MKSEFEKFYLSQNPWGRSQLDAVQREQMKTVGYMNPYVLEERQLNMSQLDVFSRLMADRIVYFGTEIRSETCNILNAQLLYLDSVDHKDINLYINSGGGEVYSGLSCVDTFSLIQSDVATTALGLAASMAAIFLVSGEKGKRKALPHTRIMIHQPLGGCRGQASDIEIEAKEIMKIKKELYEILAEGTGKSYDEIWNACDRDNYFTAAEAKDYGLIDEVITRN